MLPTRVTVSSLIHCYSVFFRWSEIKGSEESNLPTILEEIKASFELLINLKTTNKVTWEKTVVAQNVNIQKLQGQNYLPVTLFSRQQPPKQREQFLKCALEEFIFFHT